MSGENPRKWRFTWEAQSHAPYLKLFLFASHVRPSIHCKNLCSQLSLSQPQLFVSWTEDGDPDRVTVRVPVPRVLVDPEQPLGLRALDDHIEVKVVLALPVDHPVVSGFDSLLNWSGEGEVDNVGLDSVEPLVVDADLKSLSATEGVHFFCRSCSTRLTTSPIRNFVETPSANWRELADNWFGSCCCSFGGVSEKLVNRYAGAYTCVKGVCLLNPTSVILCKDDLVGCKFTEWDETHINDLKQDFIGKSGLSKGQMLAVVTKSRRAAVYDSQNRKLHAIDGKSKSALCNSENPSEEPKFEVMGEASHNSRLSHVLLAPRPGCCDSAHHAQDYINEVGREDVTEPSLVDQETMKGMELLERSILNGFLGNIFMARSYNLSKDIEWKQFFCPQCSSLLGAYPCASGEALVDDGVRLFKCYLSTSLPVGGSGDLFKKYTLERMLTNELVESAKDELSFRTVVRDVETRSPMLQVVLLNPESWCCSGICSDTESTIDKVSKLSLQPVIKVLFADCNSNSESQSRVLEGWRTKNLADEVFMLRHLIEELIKIMARAKDAYPSSCTFVQGLYLSFLLR